MDSANVEEDRAGHIPNDLPWWRAWHILLCIIQMDHFARVVEVRTVIFIVEGLADVLYVVAPRHMPSNRGFSEGLS